MPTSLNLTFSPGALAGAADAGAAPVQVPAQAQAQQTAQQGTADIVAKAADIYTKWVPGDVLAAYIALTSAFRATAAAGETLTPHAWGILVAGLALAAGLTLLGALSTNLSEADPTQNMRIVEIVVRIVLAVVAFGFWSLATPGAWWEVKHWNTGVLAAIAFAVSVVFALVAEITVALASRKWT